MGSTGETGVVETMARLVKEAPMDPRVRLELTVRLDLVLQGLKEIGEVLAKEVKPVNTEIQEYQVRTEYQAKTDRTD